MTDWKSLKKVDAHMHILPEAVHAANPGDQGEWSYAKQDEYLRIMDAQGIEKAVIMPLNDPWIMSMEFTVEAVHKNLSEMKRRSPGRFFAFADVDYRNSPEQSAAAIEQAIDEYGLDGVKLHPNNAGVALSDGYNRTIFALAQRRHIPVAIHCYPNSRGDYCTAGQIADILRQYPELTVIVSHMGAYQWEELLDTSAYVDFSAVLPDYARKLGIAQTNEILRRFGPQRLIFATDYPCSRLLKPEEIFDSYFDILNQMDFTGEEAQHIAYGNIKSILKF